MYEIYLILEWHSTCFGRSFRPSSAVQDCTYSNQTDTAVCLLGSRQQCLFDKCLFYKCLFDKYLSFRRSSGVQDSAYISICLTNACFTNSCLTNACLSVHHQQFKTVHTAVSVRQMPVLQMPVWQIPVLPSIIRSSRLCIQQYLFDKCLFYKFLFDKCLSFRPSSAVQDCTYSNQADTAVCLLTGTR